MDTSPEYINMCRKATELQETWKPKEGDWFYDSVEIRTIGDSFYLGKWNGIHEIYNRPTWNGKDKPLDATIWLPRIDQLIELSGTPWDMMMHYCLTRVMERTFRESSAEKCIMNIVMKTNHKKFWNGEDWI